MWSAEMYRKNTMLPCDSTASEMCGQNSVFWESIDSWAHVKNRVCRIRVCPFVLLCDLYIHHALTYMNRHAHARTSLAPLANRPSQAFVPMNLSEYLQAFNRIQVCSLSRNSLKR